MQKLNCEFGFSFRNWKECGVPWKRGLGSEIWCRWGSVFVAGDWQGFAHGCTAWTAAAAAVDEPLALEAQPMEESNEVGYGADMTTLLDGTVAGPRIVSQALFYCRPWLNRCPDGRGC